MRTYDRVFQHVHKSQNVTAAETLYREIEAMFAAAKKAVDKAEDRFGEIAVKVFGEDPEHMEIKDQ